MSGECGDAFKAFLTENRHLESLKLNWNNIRGTIGSKIIQGLALSHALKHIEFSNNLLGITYDGIEAPANKFSDLLLQQAVVEHIDLSFNFIEPATAFCIGHGLKFAKNLNHMSLEGNPVGAVGLRFLIQSMNFNKQALFTLNLKDISSDSKNYYV